jgi:WhiB family redox-sensing transcriptional regulator
MSVPLLAILLEEDSPWRLKAACLGMSSDLFFPQSKGSNGAAARRICVACCVQAECLDYALHLPWNRDLGIWGNTNAIQRRKLRRRAAA